MKNQMGYMLAGAVIGFVALQRVLSVTMTLMTPEMSVSEWERWKERVSPDWLHAVLLAACPFAWGCIGYGLATQGSGGGMGVVLHVAVLCIPILMLYQDYMSN